MASRSGQRISDSRKLSLTLGKLIKSGGAGSVYHLDGRRGEVVKLYHDKIDKPLHQRKIEAMLDLAPKLPPTTDRSIIQMAWPLAEAFDERKRFIGFVMPELDVKASIELEYILQDRQAKAHNLPTGLGAKITLAANLCALIDALHKQHHYVVDMKPLNLRFYRDSLYMAMLDCDGFSIQGHGERFPAEQFTIEYLAPEFQAKGMIPAGKEEEQDRFALAVIIFQLLNFGLHPYSGRPQSNKVPTDLPGRIRGGHYAYGRQGRKDILPSPVSGHEQMADDIRHLFDRAFLAQVGRPSARDWLDCLSRYALRSSGGLEVCKKSIEHQHFAGKACAACLREQISKQARKAGPKARQRARVQARQSAQAAGGQPRTAAQRAAQAAAMPGFSYPRQTFRQSLGDGWQRLLAVRLGVWPRILIALTFPFLFALVMALLATEDHNLPFSLPTEIIEMWNGSYVDKIIYGFSALTYQAVAFLGLLAIFAGAVVLLRGKRP